MKKIDKSTMGGRIKEQRTKAGMTQEELAEIFCVKKATISMYENDKIDIKGSVIVELAEVLHTTAGYLLNNEVDSNQMDGMDKELIILFRELGNEKIRQIAIEQMKALNRI